MNLSATKLDYFDDMHKLQSRATILSYLKCDDGRNALILDSTIFHPQGGGQPADTGFISFLDSHSKFVVQDVRSKEGIIFHYGYFENAAEDFFESEPERRKEVILDVDESRRKLNSRLHSAGHLLDICLANVGLGHLEPGKAYHFPDGSSGKSTNVLRDGLQEWPRYVLPYVEYKGSVPQNDLKRKQEELEVEANKLISRGVKVSAAILSYAEASEQCGGSLPDYISKSSTPRILRIGQNPGCPCGGTHVSDISEIISIKVSQLRTKKGVTKVSYNVGA